MSGQTGEKLKAVLPSHILHRYDISINVEVGLDDVGTDSGDEEIEPLADIYGEYVDGILTVFRYGVRKGRDKDLPPTGASFFGPVHIQKITPEDTSKKCRTTDPDGTLIIPCDLCSCQHKLGVVDDMFEVRVRAKNRQLAHGNHYTVFPEETMPFDCFDAAIRWLLQHVCESNGTDKDTRKAKVKKSGSYIGDKLVRAVQRALRRQKVSSTNPNVVMTSCILVEAIQAYELSFDDILNFAQMRVVACQAFDCEPLDVWDEAASAALWQSLGRDRA